MEEIGSGDCSPADISTKEEPTNEHLQVFCRIKPLDDPTQHRYVRTENEKELIVSPPYLQETPRKAMKYDFKKVFADNSEQTEVFNEVAMPLMQNLVEGCDGLLLTYGISGSGKTHTMMGSHNEVGIIPRCINALFNTLDGKLLPRCTFKHDLGVGFQIQSAKDATMDRKIDEKNRMKSKKCPVIPAFGNDGTAIQNIENGFKYAIFISYIEIYNNIIYDLLDEDPITKTLQSKILRETQNQQVYIHGVTELEVQSSEEVFEILTLGSKRRKVAETKLNVASSRSHSIFTVRLVKIPSAETQDLSDKSIHVSQLLLVDLAGSERHSRTHNAGVRLKEASAINNCLMQLRLCLRLLKQNQDKNMCQHIPYRARRLTMLFKRYFEGTGRIKMIVCMNPSVKDYEENLQVLEFAEMVQEIELSKSDSLPDEQEVFTRAVDTEESEVSDSEGEEDPLKYIQQFRTMNDLVATLRTEIQENRPQKLYESLNSQWKMHHTDLLQLQNYAKDLRTHFAKTSKFVANSHCQLSLTEDKLLRMKTLNNVLRQELNDTIQTLLGFQTKNAEQEKLIENLHEQLQEQAFKNRQTQLDVENQKEQMQFMESQALMEKDRDLKRQRERLTAEFTEKVKHLEEVATKENKSSTVSSVTGSGSREHLRAPVVNMRSCNSNNADAAWVEHLPKHVTPSNTVFKPIMKKRKSLTKLKDAKDLTSNKKTRYLLMSQDADNTGNLQTNLFKGDILPTCTGGAQVVFGDVEILSQRDPNQ